MNKLNELAELLRKTCGSKTIANLMDNLLCIDQNENISKSDVRLGLDFFDALCKAAPESVTIAQAGNSNRKQMRIEAARHYRRLLESTVTAEQMAKLLSGEAYPDDFCDSNMLLLLASVWASGVNEDDDLWDYAHLNWREVEVMTFAQFRQTGRDCQNIGEAIGEETLLGVSGRLYCDDLSIEDTQSWKSNSTNLEEGRWYLLIGRDEYRSDNLEELERYLYRFAIENEYTV
jgi:hypothetical protein